MEGNHSDRLKEIARRIMNSVRVSSGDTIPPIVYHYTDAAGLVGMLKSHKIWATDYRFLNDNSEVEHTRSIANQLIQSKVQSCSDEICEAFYQEVMNYQNLESTADEFVFSLSGQEDDLSQWRGYAHEGQGFTIGFVSSVIAAGAQSGYWFSKIVYDEEDQIKPLNAGLSQLEYELSLQVKNGRNLEVAADDAGGCFDWLVENIAVFHKHGSFRSENEWRVVLNVGRASAERTARVRASGTRLVRYAEISLSGNKLPIESIGIGPGFYGSEQIHAVKSLCAETGYEPRIYSANTPYRRLSP